MNNWNFVARLGADAELRHTPKGEPVCSFRCAVDSGWGERKATTWPTVQLWGKRAESLKPYLSKGTQVAVSGEVTLREYDKKDGSKGYSLDVRAADVTLLGKAEKAEPKPSKPSADWQDDADAIPF
ncbi:hypothetical protein IP84_16875 [beta proteobacterium AAP99]|nr:hypothetical protein IP84_16875 [beta proteobacterium AAP99]